MWASATGRWRLLRPKGVRTAAKPVRDELDGVKRSLAAIEDPVRFRLLRDKYIAFDREREAEPAEFR